MKRCPKCGREYDSSMMFCLDDGAELLYGPGTADEAATAILPSNAETIELSATEESAVLPPATTPLTGESFDKRLLLAPLALAVIVLAGFFAYRYFSPANVNQFNSIAVMPFVNETGNADFDYLSDGMAETLISSLTQLPNLNVKARSVVFRYKGKETAPKALGRELNVQAILLGRIAQRGDQLTLSLELVDVATENAIWNQQFNRRQSDIISLQSEIAREVSGKIKSKLSGEDVAKVGRTYTADPEAYELYLKGRFFWNKRTSESLKQAVELFNQAIAKDPNYALAYSGLAETYVLFPTYSIALPHASMPKARAAAVRAIELDDSLAEAHAALGLYLSIYSWNQPAAEREFRRAIELNPNYPTARQQFAGYCLMAMGRFDEALAEARRAHELDPFSQVISADVARALFFARRYDEAIEQLKQNLSLDPNFYFARRLLATVYHAEGAYAEAAAEFRRALTLDDDPFSRALLARSLAKLGQTGEARKIVRELEAQSAQQYVPSNGLAVAYWALGEKDKAFMYLEKDITERASRCVLYSVYPVFDDLRADPRFTEILRRVETERMD